MEYNVNLSKYLEFKNGKKRLDSFGVYPLYGGNGKYGTSNNYNTEYSIIIGRVGAYCGSVYLSESKCWVSDNAISAQLVNDEDDLYYFYYLLKMLNLNFYSVGTSQPLLTQNILKKLKVDIAGRKDQKIISSILLNYDKKIETNNKIIANLEDQAQALFKYYFIDFEPFADGNFVDSDLGLIPEGWEVVKLGKILNVLDSKRIPLSKMERDGMKKNYPYYGANGIIDYVEDYIFDGTYLLMGEDGTVINEYNRPILNYVNGKIWVNNHAHVLMGKNISTEYLYVLLSQTNIQKIVTGAVQLKINQTNLKSIRVVKPPEKIIDKYENFINYLFKEILTLTKQNQTLAQARDALLPRLMAGEIDLEGLGGSYD